MPEMPDSGEDHGQAEPVRSGDYVFILDGPAGLDDRRRAGGSNSFEPIREWKECIGGGDRSFKWKHSFLRAKTSGINTAHLACADADGLSLTRVDDGVGFDMLRDPPGEDEAAQLFGCRRPPCDDLELVIRYASGIGILEEQAAGDVLDHRTRRCGPDFDEAQILLCGEALPRFRGE